MTAPVYIPLRQHTEFSITDGTLRIKELVKKAAAFGLPALGISDLMNTFGLVKFYKACRGAGIKPVVGADVWVANPDNSEQPFRAMLLVRNEAGYRRLCELLTRAYVGTDRNVAHAELEPRRNTRNGFPMLFIWNCKGYLKNRNGKLRFQVASNWRQSWACPWWPPIRRSF